MELGAECVPCILLARCRELEKLIKDEEKRLKATLDLLNLYCKLVKHTLEGTVLATELFRFVKKVSGNPDPYFEEKVAANEAMKEVLPKARELVESARTDLEKLEVACKVAVYGNTIDPAVAGHSYDLSRAKEEISKVEFQLNHVKEFYEYLKRLKKGTIVYLVDNAGEAVLDAVLVEVLKSLGFSVVVAVKGGSYQNDVTINDVEMTGLVNVADRIVSTGSDACSLLLDQLSEEFVELVNKSDAVVAKGMAYFETPEVFLNAIRPPIFFLFMAKCQRVARSLGVEVGSYVAYCRRR